MFGLGFTEILAIGVILFIFFGAKRLPALGSSLAQGIRNFQRGLQGKEDPKVEGPHKEDQSSDRDQSNSSS